MVITRLACLEITYLAMLLTKADQIRDSEPSEFWISQSDFCVRPGLEWPACRYLRTRTRISHCFLGLEL